MTTTPDEASGPFGPSAEVVPEEADRVLARRARSAGEYLAGLIADGQLETVGRPALLPQDLFPDVDPEVAERIFRRGLAVGLHAGRVSSAPRLYRDQMARVQGVFEEIGYQAMGRLVGGSRRLVAPGHVHPADVDGARERPSAV